MIKKNLKKTHNHCIEKVVELTLFMNEKKVFFYFTRKYHELIITIFLKKIL